MDNICFEGIVEFICNILWGTPMLVLFIGAGVFFTVKTGFFQFKYIPLIFKKTCGSLFKPQKSNTSTNSSITPLQAVSTALGATIGTGNIAGVATAITAGGAGAVFWMWVSAIIGMMTSYAENVLGVYYRTNNKNSDWSGGAMYYLLYGLGERPILKKFAKPLSLVFAASCLVASFGIGNMTQSNTVYEVIAHGSFLKSDMGSILTGVVLSLITAAVLCGGVRRVTRFSEKLLPIMSGGYILGAAFVLIQNRSALPSAFVEIFKGAFGLNAILGGGMGIAIKETISFGLKRGVFSNEAGLGSSVIVNSTSSITEPAEQGMWGIFTVFFDTILICSLTALVILVSGAAANGNTTGAALVTEAFSASLHSSAGIFVAVATILFAFGTIIGWYFYGVKCVEYLFGKKFEKCYLVFYIIFVFLGAVLKLNVVWQMSDIFNGLMALPNLFGVFVLSKTVFAVTNNYLARTVFKKTYITPLLSFDPNIQAEQEKQLYK